MYDRRPFALSVALTFVLTLAIHSRTAAQGLDGVQSASAAANQDEGWSLDDVKDVFEAVHFFAITVGIGVGVWWFAMRYLAQASYLILNLDIGNLSYVGDAHIVELVATVRNQGVSAVRIRRCPFSVSAIDTAVASPGPGVLREGAGTSRLIEGEFVSCVTVIAPGDSLQLTMVVAIPRDQKVCLLTASVQSENDSRSVDRSRLLCLAASPAR